MIPIPLAVKQEAMRLRQREARRKRHSATMSQVRMGIYRKRPAQETKAAAYRRRWFARNFPALMRDTIRELQLQVPI